MTPQTPLERAQPAAAQAVAAAVFLAVAYVLLGRTGLQLASVGRDVTLIWPPSGLSVAVLLVYGVRLWPAVAAGALVTNILAGSAPLLAAGVAAGNTLEAVTAVLILRAARFSPAMTRRKDLGWFVLGGVLLAPLLAASVGTATLTLGGKLPVDQWPMAWAVWWVGDASSVLVVGPAVLGALQAIQDRVFLRRTLQMSRHLVVLGLGTLAAFGVPAPPEVAPLVTALVPLALLTWTSLAQGFPGAAAGSLVVNGVAVLFTVAGLGPYALPNSAHGAVALWMQFTFTSLIPLLVSVLGTEQRQSEAERMDAQQHLQESQARLSAVFDGAAEAILALDDHGAIALCNPAAERLLGVSAQALYGTPLAQFIPCGTPELLSGGNTAPPWKGHVHRPGGVRIPVEGVASLGEGGGLRLHTVILRDTTERDAEQCAREALEGQLRQAQKMEAIGQLAGGVAHDFNNLLQVITGTMEMAFELHGLPSLRDELAPVRDAASRAAALTRQLLAFSQRQTLQRVPLDLATLVQGHLQMTRRLLGSVETVVDAPAALPLILADSAQVEQVLLNLCINARDAMDGQGRLTIRLERVAEAPGMPHGAVRMRVEDTGNGIAPQDLPRVFDPFFTTKTLHHGSGLGLAVVQGIVRQHGGTIAVESAAGGGAIFTVDWPLAPADARAVPSSPRLAPLPAHGGGATVLLAEDEPTVRDLATRILTRAGYVVLAAADGLAAVELMQTHGDHVAVAVLDVLMPRLDGVKTLGRLRALRPGLPVVLCSGYSATLETSEAMRGGPAAYVPKPYTPATLAGAVYTVLQEAGAAVEPIPA